MAASALGSRRGHLLLFVLAAVALACGGRQAGPSLILLPAPEATPEPAALAEPGVPLLPPIPTPQPSPTPVPAPRLELSPEATPQGGAFLVAVRHALGREAALTFAGRRYPLLAQGDLLWGVVGVDADQAPGVYPLAVALAGARESLTARLEVTPVQFALERLTLPPQAQALLDPRLFQEDAVTLARVYSGVTPARWWQGAFLLPVAGSVSDPFGTQRIANGTPLGRHTALDLSAEEGAAVLAANGGRVAFVGTLPIRGNSVVVDHGAGVFSGYFHLSRIEMAEGAVVTKGERLGAVGQTGLATGPHLHWEVAVREVRVDPLFWVRQGLEP